MEVVMNVGSIIENDFREGERYHYAYWHPGRSEYVVIADVVVPVLAVSGVVVPRNSAVSQQYDVPLPRALIVGEMTVESREFWVLRYWKDWYGDDIFHEDIIIEKGRWFKEVC